MPFEDLYQNNEWNYSFATEIKCWLEIIHITSVCIQREQILIFPWESKSYEMKSQTCDAKCV